MGPTASGKTKLALALHKHFLTDIISVDSALVYRGLDIGTAKPTLDELKHAPHRLIDLRDPSESYSGGEFYQDAKNEIESIVAEQRIPLLVGGTMMYFNLLQRGFSELPPADASIREEIDAEAKALGWPAMHEKLKSIDPKTADQIHPNDSQRVQRALEVYRTTQQPMSHWQTQCALPPLPYTFINIVLMPNERARLHERIEQRLQQMFDQGFVDEVRELHQRDDLHGDLPAMRMVGYRQVWEYLDGEYDEAEMRRRALFATRQFAKRQLTWLRSWPDTHCFDTDDPEIESNVVDLIRREIGSEAVGKKG